MLRRIVRSNVIFVSFFVLLALPFGAFAQTIITVNAGRGPVEVHVPASYNPDNPAPLLMLLHGFRNPAEDANTYFKLQAPANDNGYIYTYPQGRTDVNGDVYWDATDYCCDLATPNGDEDSIYLKDLIEEIENNLNVHPKKIYVFGYSNGGMMAHRMACDHSEKVAAVVSFAGPMYNEDDYEIYCKPEQPVHVLHMHGNADTTAPYDGGTVDAPDDFFHGELVPGAVKTVELWGNLNNCTTTVIQEDATQLNFIGSVFLPPNETTVTRHPSGCDYGGSAELWTVDAAPHYPPGGFNTNFPVALFDYFAFHTKYHVGFSSGDRETITWTADPVATEYRMYRGSISGLVDGNSDGLPDGGYGACQFEVDETDTTFVDVEIPPVSDGYYYLVGVVDNEIADIGGLGKAKSGSPPQTLHRDSPACP